MDELVDVILATDTVDIAPQRAMNCRPGVCI